MLHKLGQILINMQHDVQAQQKLFFLIHLNTQAKNALKVSVCSSRAYIIDTYIV